MEDEGEADVEMQSEVDEGGGVGLEGEELFSKEEDLPLDVEDERIANLERAAQLDARTRAIAAALTTKNADELLAAVENTRRVISSKEGGDVLQNYVLASPKCSELEAAWDAGPGSIVSVPLLQLLSDILRHPVGKINVPGTHGSSRGDAGRETEQGRTRITIRLRLDKLASSIVRTRMRALYSHLSSSQRARQNAALILLTSIVCRGRILAVEVARNFDFTLEALRKLAKPPWLPAGKMMLESQSSPVLQPTRIAFIEFAISFLTMGDPGLVRWILLKRPLYAGVLNVLARDDEATILKVLKTLQKKVIDPSALVPPGSLSSVFGDVALDQLAQIAANNHFEEAAALAYQMLFQFCTHPSHGLNAEKLDSTTVPGTRSFGSGHNRILRLLLQLKPTTFDRHKDLLLAVTNSSSKLAAAYLDSLPFALQPRVSTSWFSVMSIVTELIPRANKPPPFSSFAEQGLHPPPLDGLLVQSCIRSLIPRGLPRGALNKGLQHANVLVKHVTLAVILVTLQSAERLLSAVLEALEALNAGENVKHVYCPDADHENLSDGMISSNISFNSFLNLHSVPDSLRENNNVQSCGAASVKELEGCSIRGQWIRLARYVQDALRGLLPDPQILLGLLNSGKVNDRETGLLVANKKRKPNADDSTRFDRSKKQRTFEIAEGHDATLDLAADVEGDESDRLSGWETRQFLPEASNLLDSEDVLYEKVLEVLSAYQRVLPVSLAENHFDAFKLLPDAANTLSCAQQRALLALLMSATDYDYGDNSHNQNPLWADRPKSGPIFRHLKALLCLMVTTNMGDIREKACKLAFRAMMSSGAFDAKTDEVWLLLDLIPQKLATAASQDAGIKTSIESVGDVHSLFADAVVVLLSDAITAVGQNIYKYVDQLQATLAADSLANDMKTFSTQKGGIGRRAWEFGPFVPALLSTWQGSKAMTQAQRVATAMYVASVLTNLLFSQAYPRPLAVFINHTIHDENKDNNLDSEGTPGFSHHEWIPVKQLLLTARSIIHNGNTGNSRSHDGEPPINAATIRDLFTREAQVGLKTSDIANWILYSTPDGMVDHFPSLLQTMTTFCRSNFFLLFFHISVYRNLLKNVADTWPDSFGGCLLLLGSKQRETTKVEDNNLPSSFSATTTALAQLMKQLPFHIIFPALASSLGLLSSTPVISLLADKISNLTPSRWLFSAKVILSSIAELAAMGSTTDKWGCIQTCFIFLKQMVIQFNPSQVLTAQGNAAFERIACYRDLICGVLAHPLCLEFLARQDVTSLLEVKISESGLNFETGKSFENELEWLVDCSIDLKSKLASGRRKMKVGDYFVLELLIQILEQCRLLDVNSGTRSARKHLNHLQQLMITCCQSYIQSAVAAFQVQMAGSKGVMNLLASPTFYAMTALLPYVNPDILVDVLFNLFSETSKGDYKPLTITPSLEPPTLYIASLIFHALSSVCVDLASPDQPATSVRNVFDENELEKLVYVLEAVVRMVMRTGSELGDGCLLFALRALQSPGNLKTVPALSHSASLVPIQLLWYCVQHPTRTKSQILGHLMNYSPVLMEEFGRAIAYATLDEKHNFFDQIDMETAAAVMITQSIQFKNMTALSDEGLMLLLAPALLYLTYQVKDRRMFITAVIPKHVAQLYGRLLREIIKQWDRPTLFMEQTTAQLSSVGCDNERDENIQSVFYNSTLGMIVRMLHLCQGLETTSLSEINSLSRSMLAASDIFLKTLGSPGFLCSETEKCQGAAETVARVAILGGLLAPASPLEKAAAIPGLSISATSGSTPEQGPQKICRRKSRKLVKFISFLVNSLDMFLKLSSLENSNNLQETESFSTLWFSYTEKTLLQSLLHVTKSVDSSVWDSNFVSLVKSLFTLVLRYRFTNIAALKSLRSLTEALIESEGLQGSSIGAELSSDVLDLILSHSQFVPSLVPVNHQSALPDHVGAYAARGTALSSLPFLLGLIGSPRPSCSVVERLPQTREDNKVGKSTKGAEFFEQDDKIRLEMVKLLRLLFAMKLHPNIGRNIQEDVGTLHEVLSLLLAAYGATMSPVDQEIFNLMHEIELYAGAGFCGLSRMNYLWGQAAGKRRKVKGDENQGTSLGGIEGDEANFEFQKRSFKEDMDVDPKRCGLTVWCFPQRRGPWAASLGAPVKGTAPSGLMRVFDPSDQLLAEAAYDPAFILPFAANALDRGFLGPEEFVRLGLLAVSLASISSADDAMRKIGYDILTKYMKAVEDGPRFKGSQQIQVLLSSVKNAIADPWQRIPFVSAVFAAEASCILMHPEGVHYLAVNRFLLQGPSLDVEHVPLLHTMLGSGQPQFRNERAWILRLLAAGLMSSLDARIYRRRFILEILMSLYSSPLTDIFSQKWVLQIFKKASRVRSCARHMVEHLGALSWLSSAAVVRNEPEVERHDQQEALDIQIMCLEVLESVLFWKTVQEYGASEGFDELVKIALQLHQHLATKTENPRERRVYKKPALRIITLVIRLSQRRKRRQTKLRFPFKFLVDIVDWVEKADGAGDEDAEETRVLALLLLLQSPPPPVSCHEDRVMLLAIAGWAVPIALSQASYHEEEWDQETMPEKLLRWMSAALVTGLTKDTSLASTAGQDNNFWFLLSSFSGGLASRVTCHELAKLVVMLHGHSIREASEVSLEFVVNALVMLLPSAGLGISGPDCNKAIQNTLKLLLTELAPPAEIASSWHWSFKRRPINFAAAVEANEFRSAYMDEVRSVLLVLCQQLLVASSPSFQCHLVDRWKHGLRSVSTSSSSGNELQQTVNLFRDKLASALQSV